MTTAKHYTTGEAAHHIGVSASTLRRWERAGTVKPASRTIGGERRYSDADLARMRPKPRPMALDTRAEWQTAARNWIEQRATTQTPFTSNDMRKELPEPDHGAMIGGAISGAIAAGIISAVGTDKSAPKSSNYRRIQVWNAAEQDTK